MVAIQGDHTWHANKLPNVFIQREIGWQLEEAFWWKKMAKKTSLTWRLYRPIACFPTTLKILQGMRVNSTCLEGNSLCPVEKRENTIIIIVIRQNKQSLKQIKTEVNFGMAWVDFQTARKGLSIWYNVFFSRVVQNLSSQLQACILINYGVFMSTNNNLIYCRKSQLDSDGPQSPWPANVKTDLWIIQNKPRSAEIFLYKSAKDLYLYPLHINVWFYLQKRVSKNNSAETACKPKNILWTGGDVAYRLVFSFSFYLRGKIGWYNQVDSYLCK